MSDKYETVINLMLKSLYPLVFLKKKTSVGVQVILGNLTPELTTIGVQINTLPGSQGIVDMCKQKRSSCEEPPPQGKPFPPPPDLILLHDRRFSISSLVCHHCLQQQREDWQPLQNMTNTRQPQ